MGSIPQKRCQMCNELKPLTSEYWHKNSGTRDKYCHKCKDCRNGIGVSKRRELGIKSRKVVVVDGKRQCTRCGAFYPETNEFFFKDSTASKKLSRTCKFCTLRRVQQYNAKHPEVHYLASKKYRHVHADRVKEDARIRRRVKYANNPEYREKIKQNSKNKNSTPEGRLKALIQVNKRRTRLLEQDFSLNKQEWESCLEYWGYKCAVCGKSQSFWDVIAMDHWQPVSKGGGTSSTNCIPLCHSRKGGYGGCNNNKNNRDPLEWLIDKLGKRKAKQKLAEIETYFEWVRNRDK